MGARQLRPSDALLERPLVLALHLLFLLRGEVVLDVERLADLLGSLACRPQTDASDRPSQNTLRANALRRPMSLKAQRRDTAGIEEDGSERGDTRRLPQRTLDHVGNRQAGEVQQRLDVHVVGRLRVAREACVTRAAARVLLGRE